MATEEELRDAQIDLVGAQKLKTANEAELAKEQLRELQRSSHIVRRVSQGIGVGLVLALAGMALFGPIKDTIEAESKLASLDARIAERTNTELQQRLDERQKLLDEQEASFTEDLKQLSDDLKSANATRDAAIARSEELAAREKELAAKYDQLASELQDNEELVAEAKAAHVRAVKLINEVAHLRVEAKAAEETTAKVVEQLKFRTLNDYNIVVSGDKAGIVQKRLKHLGLEFDRYDIGCSGNAISYAASVPRAAADLLAEALGTALPTPRIRALSGTYSNFRELLSSASKSLPAELGICVAAPAYGL